MSGEQMMTALSVLGEYVAKQGLSLEADHDVIWLTGGPTPNEITPDHAEKLEAAGWFWGEYDCWTHHC